MGKWAGISIQAPAGFSEIGNAVSSGFEVIKSTLEALKVQLQTTQAQFLDPTTATQQALNQAIQQIIEEIKTLIDEFLLSTGLYILVIPIPKRALIDPRSITDDQDRNVTNPTYFPVGPFMRQLPEEQRQRLYNKIDFVGLFNPSVSNIGGNAYIIKTLTESLYDNGDLNRPRWDKSMYWASCEIIIGAVDFSQMSNMLLFIDGLLSGITTKNQNLSRSQLNLVPQTLNAHIAYPETSSKPAIILDWPPLPIGKILSAFDSARVVPIRIAIIRSTNFRSRSALKVTDLFSSRNLTTGMTGQFGATVIFEGPFDYVTNRFVDQGPFEEDTDYHYHLSFKTRLETPNDNPVLYDYDALSPCVKLRYSSKKQTPTTPSVPPDWVRTPSVVELVPPLAQFLTQIKTYLDNFSAGFQTFTDHQQAYVQFLDKQIQKYTKQSDDIVQKINQLTAILGTSPSTGGYIRFSDGQGPVPTYVADFVESITNDEDENKPPFDSGTEFTAGVIFIASGPDPTALFNAFGLLRLLFGSSPTASAITEGINSITQTIAVAEDSAIQELTLPSIQKSNTFALDGTPLPPGTPDPNCVS